MKQDKMNRRTFGLKILWGFSALIGILTLIPVLGALFAPLLRKTSRAWREIGSVHDYKSGETVLVKFKNALPLPWSGLSSDTAAWLQKISDHEFVAYSINCTHLGCPVRWIPDAKIFLCPCHGGVYNKDGSYAAGPPPHGLNKYPVRIRNERVEIQTSPVPITNIGGIKS